MVWFLERFVFTAWFIAMIYLLIGYSIPYSWYVNVKSTQYEDICVGTSMLSAHSTRTPSWTMEASSYGQLIKFTDHLRLETDIKRGSKDDQKSFAYEAEFDAVNLTLSVDKTINSTGIYGLQNTITIYPLPFIKKTTITPAEQNLFKVIDCEL